jgi:DNA-binding MarR family transcriptional regulator
MLMREDRHLQDMEEAMVLAEQLRPALHRLYRQLRRESDDPNISPLQALLLVAIIGQPGIGVAELARLEKLRGPTISGHIKAMEQAGLVARSAPDPRDGRRNGLIATAKGLELIETIKRRRTDWLAIELLRLDSSARQAIREAIGPLGEIGK